MRSADELNRRSATELARLIRGKSISPIEVLQAHLQAIERLNPKVNAICTLAAESAMTAAERAEEAIMAGDPIGPLHGLPIGIKDVTPTAGIRATFGSPLYANNVPTEDAAVVSRLKQAGAIILGKTNTPEFAAGANTVNRVFGATRNPWNLALSVGGSTGGGAAAVACGMVALAEGTDFGGSLRIPAAFCGVVGLRPTAGLVPRYPTPLPWDVGTVHGPMGRTVEDTALMLEAMTGDGSLSPISVPAPWENLATVVKGRRILRTCGSDLRPTLRGLALTRRSAILAGRLPAVLPIMGLRSKNWNSRSPTDATPILRCAEQRWSVAFLNTWMKPTSSNRISKATLITD
jgi:amidase